MQTTLFEYGRLIQKEDGPWSYTHTNAQRKQPAYLLQVTHGDVDDLVYNDFYVEAGADVIIVVLFAALVRRSRCTT